MTDNYADSIFNHDPVLGEAGWIHWNLNDDSRFNAILGDIQVKFGSPALVRMFPEQRHTNIEENLHGGTTLAFLDIALFAGCRGLNLNLGHGPVTLDVSCQFVGAGKAGSPLIAEIELVRETYRMVFLRGRMLQNLANYPNHIVASFTGLVKKGKNAA